MSVARLWLSRVRLFTPVLPHANVSFSLPIWSIRFSAAHVSAAFPVSFSVRLVGLLSAGIGWFIGHAQSALFLTPSLGPALNLPFGSVCLTVCPVGCLPSPLLALAPRLGRRVYAPPSYPPRSVGSFLGPPIHPMQFSTCLATSDRMHHVRCWLSLGSLVNHPVLLSERCVLKPHASQPSHHVWRRLPGPFFFAEALFFYLYFWGPPLFYLCCPASPLPELKASLGALACATSNQIRRHCLVLTLSSLWVSHLDIPGI